MKSQIKLLVSVVESLIDDWGCTISSRDVAELTERAEREGFAFLASTLPTMDDQLLAGLSTGNLDKNPRFQSLKKGSPVPKLLNGLWLGIFEECGALRHSPNKDAIFALRQITRLFKKVFEVCEESKVDAAITRFIETDGDLPDRVDDILVGRVNAVLHGRALFAISTRDSYKFAHGPGATAERLDSVARWDFPSVSTYLASRFDIADFFPFYAEDWPCTVTDEQVGRVVAVPKNYDKPRLISIEPASAIYAQKGVLAALDKWMVTIPQINMRDQSRNNSLALLGSKDGGLSTIDLSEASDRVSLALIDAVFRLTPSFHDLILGLRTRAVDTGQGVLPLRKYASMGCALTFPVQMLVFRSIIIAAMCELDGDTSTENIRAWGRRSDVGVFGDDIIVPTPYVSSVMQRLEDLGLRVNTDKSFFTGLFRESCGGDYYDGTSVKPVYIRQQPPANRHDVKAISSYAATSLLFEELGLSGAAKHLSGIVEGLIGPSPAGDGAIAVSHPSDARTRYNKRLQRVEVLANVASPKRKVAFGSDYARLAQSLHLCGVDEVSEPAPWDKHFDRVDLSTDPLRLTHHGRPTSAFISRRWVAHQ